MARYPGGLAVIQILKALRTEGAKCIKIPGEPCRTADPRFAVGLREERDGGMKAAPAFASGLEPDRC